MEEVCLTCSKAVHQDALLAHLAASDDAHARAPRDGAVDSNDLESLDADPVRVTRIRIDVGGRGSPVAERMTSELPSLSSSPADAAAVAPWLPAPLGVDHLSPADGVFNHLADLTSDDGHPIRRQRYCERTESLGSPSLASPEGVVTDGHTSVLAPLPHQPLARGLTSHMSRVALADEQTRAAQQDARPVVQQLLPLSERNVVATMSEGVALVLLTASVMSAIQWAHVVVAVLALAFKLASCGKQPPSTVEGRLRQALSGARRSDLGRIARGLTSMRSRACKAFFSGTSWRASFAMALLRG